MAVKFELVLIKNLGSGVMTLYNRSEAMRLRKGSELTASADELLADQ